MLVLLLLYLLDFVDFLLQINANSALKCTTCLHTHTHTHTQCTWFTTSKYQTNSMGRGSVNVHRRSRVHYDFPLFFVEFLIARERGRDPPLALVCFYLPARLGSSYSSTEPEPFLWEGSRPPLSSLFPVLIGACCSLDPTSSLALYTPSCCSSSR